MTRKLLVAIDGSENANRALDHAAALIEDGLAAELHLLSVQPPVGGVVSTFVGKADVDDFHRDEAMKVLQPAIDRLAGRGLAARIHIAVGQPGETIAEFGEQLACDQIVMGARGLGGAASLLLGSASREVIERVKTPVTVVK